jgi:hypothetical protein
MLIHIIAPSSSNVFQNNNNKEDGVTGGQHSFLAPTTTSCGMSRGSDSISSSSNSFTGGGNHSGSLTPMTAVNNQYLLEQQQQAQNEQNEVCLENMIGRAKLMSWAAKYPNRLVVCLKCEDPTISIEITPVQSREEAAIDVSLGRTVWSVCVLKEVVENPPTPVNRNSGKLARAFELKPIVSPPQPQVVNKKRILCWSRKIVYLASGEKPPAPPTSTNNNNNSN